MGLDQNTLERQGAWIIGGSAQKPTDGYGLSYFWDRTTTCSAPYALHVYPTKFLRAEVLGTSGKAARRRPPINSTSALSAIFDIGWMKLKAGLEWAKRNHSRRHRRK